MLEKIFKLKENKTDVRTEIIAGITTFMTMAYNGRRGGHHLSTPITAARFLIRR